MSVATEARVQEIVERLQADEYEVDPTAVAQAMVSRLIWDDVPELAALPDAEPGRRRRTRLRGLVRVRGLIADPVPPAALSA